MADIRDLVHSLSVNDAESNLIEHRQRIFERIRTASPNFDFIRQDSPSIGMSARPVCQPCRIDPVRVLMSALSIDSNDQRSIARKRNETLVRREGRRRIYVPYTLFCGLYLYLLRDPLAYREIFLSKGFTERDIILRAG